jgi:clan AA aspartic protease (TIGR02281 family)
MKFSKFIFFIFFLTCFAPQVKAESLVEEAVLSWYLEYNRIMINFTYDQEWYSGPATVECTANYPESETRRKIIGRVSSKLEDCWSSVYIDPPEHFKHGDHEVTVNCILAVGESLFELTDSHQETPVAKKKEEPPSYQKKKKTAQVVLNRTNGMFFSQGSINEQKIDFIVDTGATFVAMSSIQADQLWLDYSLGEQIEMRTASGVETAYKISLDSVRVGDIILKDVPAVVNQGNFPEIILLGNSFLQRLKIIQEGDKMILRH